MLHKPGQGTIFKQNKRKANQPDFKGKLLTPGGELLEVTGWIKERTNNLPEFISLKAEVFKVDTQNLS